MNWHNTTDLVGMLQSIGQGGSKRKLRLFAVYMARNMLNLMGKGYEIADNSIEAVDLAERSALGCVKSGDMDRWNHLANRPSLLLSGASWTLEISSWTAAMRWVESITVRVEPFEDATTDAELQYAADLLRELFPDPFAWKAKRCPHCQGDVTKKATRSGLMAKCNGVCLKEIDLWSNWQSYPFRHAWRTEAVVGIAWKIDGHGERFECEHCNGKGKWTDAAGDMDECGTCDKKGFIESSRTDTDFSAMPILADALEEAGCCDERILNHCRQTRRQVRCMAGCQITPCDDRYRVYESAGPDSRWVTCDSCNGVGFVSEPVQHLRGCWVIDLILEKE